MQEKAKQIAELLKILSNENRLQILCELMEGPKTVSAFGQQDHEHHAVRAFAAFGAAEGLRHRRLYQNGAERYVFHRRSAGGTGYFRIETAILLNNGRIFKMAMIVNQSRCPQNHRCPSIAVCPKGAITQKDPYSLPVIDQEKCIECGKCIRFCPRRAIEKV